MAPLLVPLIGAAVGGAAMYLFDPDRGRRRRALLRDQAVRTVSNVRDTVDAGTRDLANRSVGMTRRLGSVFTRREATDEVIVERVRAKMGRYVSHPAAIEVASSGGQVTLSGSVLHHEHEALLRALHDVDGVHGIEDRLKVYKTAEGVSELQGGRRRRGEPFELMQDNWAPGARIVAGTAGATLAMYALRGGLPGLALGTAGALLLLRSTTNRPFRQLAGMSGRRSVDIQKTITINAPVEQVFEYLSAWENYPRFMRNVRSITPKADGQLHWVVAGPAGTEVSWDSMTTQFEPNEIIAWRTVEGSPVAHAGIMRFERAGAGTRVHIRMSYNPPAGAVGHVVAKLFGADPKSEMDEDFMRLKSTLETGRPPRDAAARLHTGSTPLSAA
jgi:uncharacterized membrane protein